MTGQKLGRFEIIREIGKGAMGVVYLAHDPKIDRRIAIKMVAMPEGVSPEEAREARHRFVREAQAAGKLQHPNIITIYDVVEEESRSYIAMEYIEGETLEPYCKPGSLLPLEKVLSVTAQACAALDYAHKNHVIHRDIKPANLMLVKGELVKITDFGLAKHPEANLTQAGVLIGTPNYMSPEQISGRAMDGRSDFFSLGVVLYELLTGERPFGGDTISTIIYRILYEEARSPRIVNEKLPVAFDSIFKKVLAKDPADRFQTGAEFIEALNNYSTYHLRRPVSAAPPTVRAPRPVSVPGSTPRRERARREPDQVEAPPRLFAGQPFKVAAFAMASVLALLLFPRRVHEGREGGPTVAELTGPVAQDRAGFGAPSLPPGPAPAIPRAEGRTVTVLTDRPQAKLFLDSVLLHGNTFPLREGDENDHTVLAVDGCHEDSRLIRGSQIEGPLRLELKPKVADLRIDSKPGGAQVYLNDKRVGTTPLDVPAFNACEPAKLMLRKENYRDYLKTISGEQAWNELAAELSSITLSEIPPGHIRFSALPTYPLEVTTDGKKVALVGDTLTLPEGEHTLVIRSPKVFYKKTVQVKVEGAKTRSLDFTWPGVGYLTVLAEPSNCRIFVDGDLLDYVPVEGAEIVAGQHEIRAVPDADPDRAQKRTVEITPGATHLEKFTLTF
jgi:hypothetical protein